MNDTRPEITQKVREMIQTKTPTERVKMGFSMYSTSKMLVSRAICENMDTFSEADLRKELFLRFYGGDFDEATKKKILNHLQAAKSD